jgi:signal peptidase I
VLARECAVDLVMFRAILNQLRALPDESKQILRYTSLCVKVFFIGHAFSMVGFELRSTYGISMVPTISPQGDWIILNKQYRRGRGVEVGDIVSFWNPYKLNEPAIKRVVGMPGDFVLRDTPGRGEGRMVQVCDERADVWTWADISIGAGGALLGRG